MWAEGYLFHHQFAVKSWSLCAHQSYHLLLKEAPSPVRLSDLVPERLALVSRFFLLS